MPWGSSEVVTSPEGMACPVLTSCQALLLGHLWTRRAGSPEAPASGSPAPDLLLAALCCPLLASPRAASSRALISERD